MRTTKATEVVRTQSMPKRRNWRRSQRILVAVNLTEEGGQLVTWVLSHGSRSGDTVSIIHVVAPCPTLSTRAQVSKWERQKKEMLNTLSELVTYCRMNYDVPHLSISVQIVESRGIGDAVVREARNLEATRVVLGKRRPRHIDMSPKRMTDLGRLCVQSLEPYCEILIVRRGKVLVGRPGTAKVRRSLEMLLLSNKTQESNEFGEVDSGRQLGGGYVLQLGDESDLGPSKERPKWRSESAKINGKLSAPLSDFIRIKMSTNSNLDSSFSSGTSSGGSESSPSSVLRIPSRPGKSSFSGGKIDEGFLHSSFSFTTSCTPFPSRAKSLKGATGSPTSNAPKCLSTSIKSVRELPQAPAEAECRTDQNENAHVLRSQPQLGVRKDDPTEPLVLCSQPQLEVRKDDPTEPLVLCPQSKLEDRKGDQEEQQAYILCAQPEFQDRNDALCEQSAPVLCSHPQLEADREDDPDEQRGLCSQPQSEDRKDDVEENFARAGLYTPEVEKEKKDGAEEVALEYFSKYSESATGKDEQELEEMVFARFSPRFSPLQELDYMNEEDRVGEEEALRRELAEFSPPKFARSCSALSYNMSQDGLQSLSNDVNYELPEVRRFSYEELRVASEDFAAHNVVGTGAASRVYKAQLVDGSWVALKRLVETDAGETEYMMEMMMLICTLNHPNLVTMVGFCAEGAHRLIAYELLTRGSLERNLHNTTNSSKLNWRQRHKVAFGIARGLAYLHSFSPKPIIHRDIKTANILLTKEFDAQISDFGLARWLLESDTTDDQVSCAGTFGYLAPESLMYGGFGERTDVFAFGVVLLELISGRRPMDESLPESEKSLVLWARTLQQTGRTHHLVDRSLRDINPQQFKRVMYTAFLCVQVSPDDRPTMDRVVRLLDTKCNYSPAILQPNISAPPFMSMPEFNGSHLQSPLSMPSIPAR